MKVNLAKIKKSRGKKYLAEEKDSSEQSAENQENITKTTEPKPETNPKEPEKNVSGDIDMDKIYQKVNKKYRQDSPK
jgi:hypothetical protein